MPIGNLFRVPISLSQNGNTLVNLRGEFTGGNVYNFIENSNVSITCSNITQGSTALLSNAGPWTSTIQHCFQAGSSNSAREITFNTLLSNKTDVTIMFRFLGQSGLFFTGTVFQNGNFVGFPNDTGYKIEYQNSFGAARISMLLYQGPPTGFNTTLYLANALVSNTWYHIATKISTTNTDTIIQYWVNGTKQTTLSTGWQMAAPTIGSTSIFSSTITSSYDFRITDFVFLNGTTLTDSQIAAYANAPFM